MDENVGTLYPIFASALKQVTQHIYLHLSDEGAHSHLQDLHNFTIGFDPTSWSAKGYSSGMHVASWSEPFD